MKTPQQKKSESYKLDRRNAYGENAKASRKGIRLRKRLKNRKYRRLVKVFTTHLNLADDPDQAVKSVNRDPWTKVPDIPLEQWVVRQDSKHSRRIGKRKERRQMIQKRPIGPDGHDILPHMNSCKIITENIRNFLKK